MSVHSTSPSTAPTPETQSASIIGLLLRIVWLIAGNLAVVVCATLIATQPSEGVTAGDLALWASVGVSIGARYIDVSAFHGSTAEGAPATMADFRRYVVKLLLFATIAHAAARAIS